MNRKPLRIIGRIAIVAVVVALIATVLIDRRMKKEYARFELIPTSAVNAEIVAIWNRIVNYYLVKTPSGWIAIDSGGDPGHSRKEFAAMGFDPSLVRAVFLTHSDSDHARGVTLFPNAKVFISEREKDIATGKVNRALVFKNSLAIEPVYLSDGEAVLVDGRRVQLVEAPGHTPGSAAYIVDGKYLFTGDAFAIKDGRIDPFNEFFTMDQTRANESVYRLASLKGLSLVLTGHYGVSDKPDALFAEFLSRPITPGR